MLWFSICNVKEIHVGLGMAKASFSIHKLCRCLDYRFPFSMRFIFFIFYIHEFNWRLLAFTASQPNTQLCARLYIFTYVSFATDTEKCHVFFLLLNTMFWNDLAWLRAGVTVLYMPHHSQTNFLFGGKKKINKKIFSLSNGMSKQNSMPVSFPF